MRLIRALAMAASLCVLQSHSAVLAKKPSRSRPVSNRPRTASSSSSRTGTTSSQPRGERRAPVSNRRPVYEEEDEFEEDEDVSEEDLVDPFEAFDEDDEEDAAMPPPTKRKRTTAASRLSRERSTRSSQRPVAPSSSRKSRPPPRRYEEDFEEDFDDGYTSRRQQPSSSRRRGPPPRGGPPSSRRGPGGRVVPYGKPGAGQSAATAFTQGLTKGLFAIRSSLPDAAAVKDAAVSGISAARQTTSNLSSNLYREVKGLTSSELEQVMLKATRPDDTAVKGKHVERLVGVTYQISSRYDIYDAVLRKLWSKMAERDWRTTIKALYILHRYSADGAPEHAPALKARLRELRRTRDPKRKDKYFNSKQLLAGDANPDNIKFRAFMSRYAHYVLLRAQCFGGMFDEISHQPKPDKKKSAAPKAITSTCLRSEHLNAAGMLLKAGVVCQLKEGEECENTAIASERVASDMIGLTTAVAIALNRALKDGGLKGADPALLKKWCEFYSQELLPQTKAMVKKTSPKLDAYGLFLPSRMGASVSQDLLEKGLHLDDEATEEDETVEATTTASADSTTAVKSRSASSVTEDAAVDEDVEAVTEAALEDEEESDVGEEAVEEEAEFDEEYEYEEEEYYDDEE